MAMVLGEKQVAGNSKNGETDAGKDFPSLKNVALRTEPAQSQSRLPEGRQASRVLPPLSPGSCGAGFPLRNCGVPVAFAALW